MTIDNDTRCRMDVVEIEEFLRNPPAGFAVRTHGGCRYVKTDPESCLVLIDDMDSSKGKVCFQDSLGKKIKMHNLWDYTRIRKGLLSKKIYLLSSLCQEKLTLINKKPVKVTEVLEQFVVCIDGNNPFIRWELERGLNWTISSVAGESYRVDIDFSEALQAWGEKTNRRQADGENAELVWKDACFTLKYYSDALFDFPHWFGFSKRSFKLRQRWVETECICSILTGRQICHHQKLRSGPKD